ncbi:sigma-54 interaction domain-containing protein [Albidovulum sediminicola]|uniref:HTH-type transcriptional regulatory protein TyrR n=1 Tax=Albidovulum sediminicola TaxID=2984331 RepID=A0ABT2Z6Y0_9RHOB|nr:sigma 54-interacting transcriptional regulator [Defluviimonas sp. WL0075]MCV2866800.1 sigma 54-interacting transcriptional regulator [Defluviimonas sp. WL0075]
MPAEHGQPAAKANPLSEALDALPDGLVVIGPDGRIQLCNREAALIAGVDPASIVGRPYAALVASSSLNWTLVTEMLEAGRTGNAMMRGDSVGAVFVTVRRVRSGDGGAVITLRDLAVFDHARRQATGRREQSHVATTPERRLRPDFARQRRISPYLDRIISRGERALLQGARLIITGESGVGKTEIARHLHSFVANATDPFVAVNCAAIPESLFESELFGYEKGAFTGASGEGKKGLIETAEGGTLFLDEVGEIPPPLQAKMLSFLEDGMLLRVGGTKPRRVNLRIISATNRDLLQMAKERKFRLDLYYRLAVVNMPIKPLREVPELVDHLIERFVGAINQRRSLPMKLSDDLMERLRAYSYPGNIRELSNLLQQISVLGEDEDELPRRLARPPQAEAETETDIAKPAQPGTEDRPLRDSVADYERSIIDAAIRKHGSKRKAAAALGVDIGTIVRKTKPQEP